MAITARRLTVEDLDAIPEEHPGDRHELIAGELVVTRVLIIKHQIASMNLVRELGQHVHTRGLGMLFHPQTGIRLADDTLLIPDALFVARDRLRILGAKTVDGPPDLMVEILSPGTRRRDLETKRELYARFGVKEYWIVDPDEETVTVFGLIDEGYEAIPAAADGTIRSRVFPDLALTLGMVFAGA